MPKTALFETIACQMCGKPKSINPEECWNKNELKSSSCFERCRIHEKSLEQLEYVASSITDNVFLKACPGSGKTEVVALKTAFELSKWDSVGGIVVLSFTQNAAEVITKRVGELVGKVGYPHFIGTLDSWLLRYIANPFSHNFTNYEGKNGDKSIRLVDSSSKAGFLNSFQTKYSYLRQKIQANSFYWNAEIGSHLFSSGDNTLDKALLGEFSSAVQWQTNDLWDTKKTFWKAGFATYQDVEYFAHILISTCEDFRNVVAKRFPFVIVDECQDLSWIQMEILRHLKESGTTLHFVGDVQQAIYEFKDVEPTKVVEFVNKNQFEKLELSQNFRSNQSIVDVCQRIVNNSDVKGRQLLIFENPCICVIYKKEDLAKLSSWFQEFVISLGLSIEKSAVVARGWSTVRKLRHCGNDEMKNIQQKIAAAIYLWSKNDKTVRLEALSYMGAFVANHFLQSSNVSKSKCYCPDTCSPIKWRVFLSKVLDECKLSNLADLTVTWTAWAKSIKQQIHEMLLKHRHVLEEEVIVDFKQCNFIALRGESSTPVLKTIGDKFAGDHSSIRTTTIHQVKGETLEAIMVVSAQNKQGTSDGHWTQWLENTSSEKARLAYVASSRPKHLLVWAVPGIESSERSRLTSLGFCLKEFSALLEE